MSKSKTPEINYATCPIKLLGNIARHTHHNTHVIISPEHVEGMRAWLSLLPGVSVSTADGVTTYYAGAYATAAVYTKNTNTLSVRKQTLYALRERFLFPNYPQGDKRGK